MMNVSCSPLSECFVVLVHLWEKSKTMNQMMLYNCVALGKRRLDISEVLSVLNCERRTFEVDCGLMEKFYYVRHKKSCLL